MKPVLVQHLIKHLRKKQPNKIVEDTSKPYNSNVATVFLILFVLLILAVVFK